MPMYNRKQWVTLRDKHKVPSGAVSSANIGPCLDKYQKVVNDSKEKQLKVCKEIKKDFDKYHLEISKSSSKYKAFAPIFKKELLDELNNQINSLEHMINAGNSLKEALGDIIKLGEKLKDENVSREEYSNFYLSNPVRLINMDGAVFMQKYKEFANDFKAWKKLCTDLDSKKVEDTPKARYEAVQQIMNQARILQEAITKLEP